MRRLVSVSLFSLVLMALTAVAGCGSGSPAAGPPAPTRPAASTGSPAASSPGEACDRGTWQSAPLSGAGQTAPGAVLTAVRTAQHPECGYDRLVLDVTGPLPGYAIRYVTKVTADPSGRPVSLPGSHFLLITLHSAAMHTPAGVPTITPAVRLPGYPMLAGWAPAGDFEGYVTVAVGLTAATRVRVGELPGRLYIDFKE